MDNDIIAMCTCDLPFHRDVTTIDGQAYFYRWLIPSSVKKQLIWELCNYLIRGINQAEVDINN